MLLGDLIARFEDEAVAEEAVLAIGDLAMLAALRRQAAESGLGLGACMAAAASRYAAEASDEEWITLIGTMGRTEDPGAVYLKRAFAFAGRPANVGGCGHAGHP